MNESVVRSAKLFQDEEQRLQGAQRWDDLVALYSARAEAVDDDGLRERMLFRAGEVSLDHLSRAEQAEGYFVRAFEVRRTYLPALGALKAMHLDRKDRPAVRRVLGLEVGVTKDPRRLGQLHHELGRILREEGKPQEALAALLQAIEANPKSRVPLEDLEQLAKKHQRWDALVQAYRALAGAAQDKQAAIYQFLAGTILDESARDPDDASRAFAAALDAGPKDARILGTITRFFERRGEWALAARGLFQHLDAVQDDAKERVRLLKRLASIHDASLNAPQQAVKHLQRALELDPKDALAVKQLLGLGEKTADPRVVAHALELEAELPGLKDAERAERWERAAEQRDKAREGRAALRAVKRAVELRPRHVGALKLMESITRKLGDWPEHARTLELERELIDPRRSEQERRAAVALGKRL
ncbi:MAG: tetratricopeptide repeat protein, partial [Planctomycetota bacterium]|nr:tetratricopeptide repeat protein [Planctomycetota bacterium]